MSKYGDLVWKHAKTYEQRLDEAVTAFLIKNASRLRFEYAWVVIRSNAELDILDHHIWMALAGDTDFEVSDAEDEMYKVRFVGLPF
jgi:hypothetical protein